MHDMKLEFTSFQWDENKRSVNLVKHGIDFLDAVTIFEDPVFIKPSSFEEEERHVAVGILDTIAIAVIFTIRDGNCRIISARRARKNERREYCHLYPGGA